MSEPPEYDAFFSCSRALDGTLAPELRRGVERFAKPWYRRRAVRAFLDDTPLPDTPGRWASIESALGRSRWLVLLASPEAAASPRVAREVGWWLEHRSAHRVLVVLTAGEYSASVPAALRTALGQEPRWVDLRWLRSADQVDPSNPRLRAAVAGIASTVRGVPEDDLVGEHVRERRRTVRLARGAVTALVLLTAAVLVAAFLAVGQRDSARDEARTATARGLASAAVASVRTDLSLAQALAAEAYRVEPNEQTRAALFQALTASPQLDRYVPVGGVVSSLAASADGKVVVAGTEDGRVVRLPLTGGRTEERVSSNPVSAVAVSADGGVVVAASSGSALRWDRSGAHRTDLPGHPAVLTAVSPSGRFSAVYTAPAADGATTGTRTVHDGQTGQVVTRAETASPVTFLRLPDDGTLLEVSYDSWVRRSPVTLDVTSATPAGPAPAFGVRAGLSPNGDHYGYSWEGETALWTTTAAFTPAPLSRVPTGRASPSFVAVSPDGARTAVADTGTIHVYDMTGPDPGERLWLEGNTATPFVEFLGDGDHLVSATRDQLVLWDLTRNTRISRPEPTAVPLVCTACPPPFVASANGRTAVASGEELAVDSRALGAEQPNLFGPPVWNGDHLFLVTTPDGIGETWEVRDGMRRLAQWKGTVTADHVLAMAVSADERRVVTVNELGDVQVLEGPDLAVARTTTLNRELSQDGWPPAGHLAAVSPDTAFAAVATPDSVTVVDVSTGTQHPLPGGKARAVTFTRDTLLVQRADRIEAWNPAGTSLRHTFRTDPGYLPGLSANSTFVTQLRRDRVLVLSWLATGDLVGEVRLAEQAGRYGRIGTAFDGDTRLLTAISETDLRTWDLSAENWVRAACASAGRAVTEEEWQRFAGSPPGELTCG
ncbi:hypothetical protein ACVDFE_14615 [Lentzea chajnantorensis]